MSGVSHEDDLIARHFAPLAGPAGLGLRDDAASLTPPAGCDLVATMDALVESVHFFGEDAPDAVAKKALRVNLSDLAAKGAEPLGFLLALSLPSSFPDEALAAFARGLGEDARAYGCPLIGGDTVFTPGPLSIAITAFGAVAQGRMVLRTGARPGDRIYVSGTIGDAALGLRLRLESTRNAQQNGLSEEARAFLLDRYLLPRPRMALRAALLQHAHAAMDVSDGLIGDLTKMLRVSGVTAHVRLSHAPLSAAARDYIGDDAALLDAALTGGDDYEILAAVPADRAAEFEAEAAAAAVSVTCIGETRAGAEPPIFEDASGQARVFERPSFSHF